VARTCLRLHFFSILQISPSSGHGAAARPCACARYSAYILPARLLHSTHGICLNNPQPQATIHQLSSDYVQKAIYTPAHHRQLIIPQSDNHINKGKVI
jgi:hypothetical protein